MMREVILLTVSYEDMELTSIPNDISNTTTSLNLKINAISVIPERAFENLAILERLELSKNSISVIPTDGFTGLFTLQYLYIERNQITHMEPFSFANLTALTFLSLSRNSISEIGADTFKGLVNLTTLKMGFNGLQHIDDAAFEPLVQLQTLDCFSNGIRELPNLQTMAGTLRTLNLGGGNIAELIPNYFVNFSSLSYLSIGGRVESLLSGHLTGLRSLTTLSLDKNEISIFENMAFQGLTRLCSLSVTENQLREFPCISMYTNPASCQKALSISAHTNLIYNISEECIDTLMNFDRLSLGLSENNITDLSVFTRLLPNLVGFDVGKNGLDNYFGPGQYVWAMESLSINMNNFSNFPYFHEEMRPFLEKLDVSSNDLECVDVPHLENFTSLHELILYKNSFDAFPMYGCHQAATSYEPLEFPSLVILDLHSNNISSFPNCTEMLSLFDFNIGYNILPKLNPACLIGLANLTILKADHNMIEEFPDFRLMGVNLNISNLSLSWNQIRVIPWSHVQPLASIKFLILSHNQITEFCPDYQIPNSLDPTMFDAALMNMEGLYLESNLLTKFLEPLLWAMTNLSELQVGSNQLPSFPNLTYVVAMVPDVHMLVDISLNPLNCIEDLCWLREVNPVVDQVTVDASTICAQPSALQGRLWQDITLEELRCVGEKVLIFPGCNI